MDAVPGMPSRDGRCLRAAEGNLSRSSDTGADGTDGAARKHAALPAGAEGAGRFSCPLNRLRRMRPCASVPSGSASGSTTRACRKLGARGPKRMTDASLRCSFPEIGAKGSSSALKRRTFVALINIRREISRSSWPAAAAGGRGERGGRHFVTGSTDQQAIRDRALHSLQEVGYRGFGDVTVISDAAEILKRLPRAMPKPTTHIIDWFHIALKIQPIQQIADHIVRSR